MPELLTIKQASETPYSDNYPLWTLSIGDVQNEAMQQLGRRLTNDEVDLFKKHLDYGLGEHMLFVYPAIFENFQRR